MPNDTSPAPRTGKELLLATRPFAEEFRLKSWWYVGSTFVMLFSVLTVAGVSPWWPLRLIASIVGGLLLVRAFILYHDHGHGALLGASRVARPLFYLYGLVVLAPWRYWRHSHNFHHAHVGKPIAPKNGEFSLLTSDVGSYPLMSTEMWRQASMWQRLHYRISRHPLTILCACVTVFFTNQCLLPLLQNPRRYWEGLLAPLVHGGLIAFLWLSFGFSTMVFVFLLPYAVAAALGAYLFFAQHNFPGMKIVPPDEWTHCRGALESSSHMKLGPVMNWFTGNIGYHGVHHLNPRIPFYRLPAAMAAIPELGESGVTSLRPREIIACLRLNLWDLEQGNLVSYGEASRIGDG